MFSYSHLLIALWRLSGVMFFSSSTLPYLPLLAAVSDLWQREGGMGSSLGWKSRLPAPPRCIRMAELQSPPVIPSLLFCCWLIAMAAAAAAAAARDHYYGPNVFGLGGWDNSP